MSLSIIELTSLLKRAGDDGGDAREKLMEIIHKDLHRIAKNAMRGEKENHTLQPTALVNEAYLHLFNQTQLVLNDRAHFFALAAKVMYRILVDYARARNARRRGGDLVKVSLDKADIFEEKNFDILMLNQQLALLEQIAPRQFNILVMRFFGGLSIKEIASATDLAPSTISKEIRMARAWLHRKIEGN